ncbi:MAG: hypothetical protein GC160_05135 [Acidobacteria bacterium]|nr:hypothetical protein [Acidobacteriota bacterium]
MTYFRELQPSWNNPLAWLALAPAGIGSYAILQIAKTAGSRTPYSAVLSAAASLCLALWIFSIRLDTDVEQAGLRLRFRFLWPTRQISYEAIARAEAVEYEPIKNYGGWGLRRGKHDGRAEWVWSISGRRGVRLHFHDGETFLLGSRRPEELAAAINTRISAVHVA